MSNTGIQPRSLLLCSYRGCNKSQRPATVAGSFGVFKNESISKRGWVCKKHRGVWPIECYENKSKKNIKIRPESEKIIIMP